MNKAEYKIITINCRSINAAAKKIQLQRLLKDHHPDVVALNETWLKPTTKPLMSGYNVYRRDRPSAGGGVALLAKTRLESKPVLLPRYTSFEAVAIQLLHQDGFNSTIVTCLLGVI